MGFEPNDPSASGTAASDAVLAGRGAARLIRLVERTLSELNLSLPQYRLLGFLQAGESAAAHLAEALSVSPPSLTGLVDGLVARGLVERSPDPHDRRRVTHRLTRQADEFLACADDAVAVRLDALAAHLTPDEAEIAYHGLVLWGAAVEAAESRRRQPVEDSESTA